jgi:hypothetical protein
MVEWGVEGLDRAVFFGCLWVGHRLSLYTWGIALRACVTHGRFTYTHPIVSTALGIFWPGEVITRNLVIGG